MPIHAPAPLPQLSALHSLSSSYLLLPSHFLPPGGGPRPLRRGDLAIRNGGGPRTFPGGVSKWQWKRMQAKKARQLLKARLARERQLYEMRKRAELRDAVAHLERPWDPDSAAGAAPKLLSVAADDQLRALADRFHRPGGVDLWNDRDGPRVFASPATGAASARFFPKNAVHSVQPYALVGAGGDADAPRAGGNAADLLLPGRGHRGAQGACENAAEDEAYISLGDREPAVELMERDGTWEPVNALGDGDGSSAGDWSSYDDDDVVTSGSQDAGDAGSRQVPRAMMVRRKGRNNGVARWEAVGAMASGSDDDRGWSGDAFFSDSEGAREGHREQRWQERSSGASARKRAGGRRNALNTAASSRVSQKGRTGNASFSDSEVIRGGSEPKWRTRNGDDTRNGSGRWNAPGQDWSRDESNSNSDSARGSNLEPRWGARNKLNGRGNFRGRSKPGYSANINDGGSPGRYMRTSNGDEHASGSIGEGRYRFGGGFAKDLETPTWKPRRMNRARSNNGSREDSMDGRFRRGDNGAARRLQTNPRNTSMDDGRRMGRNGVRRFRGHEYSLRPTSELHNSCWEMGSDEL